MLPVLPFDIIALIIDIVGDTDLLKELALVSHSFLQICSKHLFATVELHDGQPGHYYRASSKKGFIKLLKSRPDVVKYISTLTYRVGYNINDDDHLLLPILSNFPTISRLNCFKITTPFSSRFDWNTLDSSLKSAFLHLMHLPTINHIDLSSIKNFPLSSLTPSVNLLRLDMSHLSPFEEDGSPGIAVRLEIMLKSREFLTSWSPLLTTKLLHAKRQDGRLSMSLILFEERDIQYLLQNAKLLEELHLIVNLGRSLVGLLSLSACTLKVLDLTVFLYDYTVHIQLAGLCEELEAMAGHNMLEVLSLKVKLDDPDTATRTKDSIGSIIQNVEKVLVKPGWSALRQVSFKLSVARWGNSAELLEELQSLPDEYLSHLSKLESVAFNYSATSLAFTI